MYFQKRCRLKHLFPLPYGPFLTKRKKKSQISQLWNVTILWTTLVEIFPRSMHDCLGVNLMSTFRRGVVWFFYSHMVSWRKEKSLKDQKFKILKNKTKNGLNIWWTGSFSKDLALIRLTVSEKTGFVDGRTHGRTPDAGVTTVALLCSSTKQS